MLVTENDMSSSPKWYYKKKSTQLQIFKTLTLIYQKGRYLTKINTDLLKFIALGDYIKVIKEYKSIFEAYDILKQEQQTTFSTIKKIKRSPYKTILLTKLHLLSNLNNKRFQQLMFVLKEMLFFSFQKSNESNISVTWGLELVGVYNSCCMAVNVLQVNGFNSNICSNNYPNLLLPQSNLKFGAVLQLLSQSRIEINILEILLELLKMGGELNDFKMESDCSPSSLEVLNILTQNLVGESDFLKNPNLDHDGLLWNGTADGVEVGEILNNQQQNLHIEKINVSDFLYKERIYVANLIRDCRRIVPSVFDDKQNDNLLLNDAIKTVWTYISTILDHVILWWIETPMSCYSIFHVDSIRNKIFADSFQEIQEPAFSSLKGLCEILTIFASNNVWDKMFRITLVTSSHSKNVYKNKESEEEDTEKGTYVGKFWNGLFNNLKIFNNFLLSSVGSSSQVAVAEQIPILHRLDHSIHSMRIWVNEQCKLKSSQWIIEAIFQLLTYDVLQCLETLSLIDSHKLSMENADILMAVCISLREKLILEINVNISKLKDTSEGCINVLSSVCRTLSLAHFSLSFPSRQYWQQNIVKENKSAYVTFVLDQIFLPALKATKDIIILELILKLICEAWVDYIYSQRMKFSTAGALALLNDFNEVKDWISKLPNITPFNINKLVNHEVLHMCKGVGKVLVRKPKEMIQIVHSPKHQKSTIEGTSQETQLPSEMFVSNQISWLQLRASSSKPSFSICCCSTYEETPFNT